MAATGADATTPLRLFGTALSPFTRKVERALGWKRLAYELVTPKGPRDFRRWNPVTRKIPVLEIRGERVYDSTFILRRLDEWRPAPPLYSADPWVAARQRLLEDWADESLYWHAIALRFSPENAGASIEQIVEPLPGLVRPLARSGIRRASHRGPVEQGFGRLPHEILLREFRQRLADLAASLEPRPYFFSDEPSAADFAVHAMLELLCTGPTPDAAREIEESPLKAWIQLVSDATDNP